MFNAFADEYAYTFSTKMFHDGITNKVSVETIQKYLSDPDNYIIEIEKLGRYYYGSNGDVFQLFDLARTLPSLNYKINTYDIPKNHEKNLAQINAIMKKVKHRQLTRDIISQTVASGTFTGIWLGDKKKPYLYIFDRVDMAFPGYMLNGEWVVQVDLSWLSTMKDKEREVFIKNLTPYITMNAYDNYKNSLDEEKRYIDLPQERTTVVRTHTLKRNQSFGTSWMTTGVLDLLHKEKLKDLEKSIANKIISAIAILTIGSSDNEKHSYVNISKTVRNNIRKGAKAALDKDKAKDVSFVSLPEFAKMEFPKMADADTLDPEKFTAINDDVSSSYGISSTVTRGSGGNYTSGKLNLDIQYKKLGVLLEDIETEVYGKLINLVLPSNVSELYELNYDKEQPLTRKEKTDYLLKVHSQSGFSLKAFIDNVGGIDFEEYVQQSIYEQEVLKLPERIKPYSNAYTSTEESETKPEEEYPENENTEKSKTSGSNDTPEVD
ncbi:hypothetical protein BSK66_26715 [Paenibacillus odorifer]|uniref:hypothetical protein n=1 Tax=Paenibacillus TaxID=44249 RepID=UPI0003E21D1B|nr:MULTISPECIES: hypothetical protein [Paenibacillus]ETT49341.1 hypothetical protein C171_23750 [Paenibacillus sp. FSL H8-237]OME49553.1 hypothetical protein BSK66_26715 [Paenibacillus odorifer]